MENNGNGISGLLFQPKFYVPGFFDLVFSSKVTQVTLGD